MFLALKDKTMILNIDLERVKSETVMQLYEDSFKFSLLSSVFSLKASIYRMRLVSVSFSRHDYTRGSFIYDQGKPASHLVVIISGEVELQSKRHHGEAKKISLKPDILLPNLERNIKFPKLGKGRIKEEAVTNGMRICIVEAGNLVGTESALGWDTYSSSAVVVSSACRVYSIHRDHIEDLMAVIKEENKYSDFTRICNDKIGMIMNRLHSKQPKATLAMIPAPGNSQVLKEEIIKDQSNDKVMLMKFKNLIRKTSPALKVNIAKHTKINGIRSMKIFKSYEDKSINHSSIDLLKDRQGHFESSYETTLNNYNTMNTSKSGIHRIKSIIINTSGIIDEDTDLKKPKRTNSINDIFRVVKQHREELRKSNNDSVMSTSKVTRENRVHLEYPRTRFHSTDHYIPTGTSKIARSYTNGYNQIKTSRKTVKKRGKQSNQGSGKNSFSVLNIEFDMAH